ncbi:MAG: hypothetical protein ACON48_07230 [Chitinophagales bacterium]
MNNYRKELWLLLSAFGIMFAILSWMQESTLLPGAETMKYWKGILAIITGLPLYFFCRKSL